jgi:hypothetical protein
VGPSTFDLRVDLAYAMNSDMWDMFPSWEFDPWHLPAFLSDVEYVQCEENVIDDIPSEEQRGDTLDYLGLLAYKRELRLP